MGLPSSSILKAVAQALAIVAEYYAFKSPNPPPKKEETAKFDGGDTISRIAYVAQYASLGFTWTIHVCEIAALLARDSRSEFATKVLATLFPNGPAAASRLRSSRAFVVGLALLVTGAAIRKACYITLGRHFTFELALLKEHKLVTWGPYSIVRHPSYTGFAAATAGMLTAHLAPGGWLAESGLLQTKAGKAVMGAWAVWMSAVTAGAIFKRVPKEDAVLRREFGQQWEAWAKRTPYVLIPYVY